MDNLVTSKAGIAAATVSAVCSQWRIERKETRPRSAPGGNRGGGGKMEVITAKMWVIRGVRHLMTFGGGKIAVHPGRR